MIWNAVLKIEHRQNLVQDCGHGRERPDRAGADIGARVLQRIPAHLDYYAWAMVMTQLFSCLGPMSASVFLR